MILILALLLGSDAPPPADFDTRLSSLVSGRHFDFIGWTLQAAGLKLSEAVAAESNYLPRATRQEIVLEAFNLLDRALWLENQIEAVFADPSVNDPLTESASLTAELESVRAEFDALQPLAEAVLQEQIAIVLSEEGFGTFGQIVPPVSFHITELPGMLIVSSRERIERRASVSLQPGQTDADEAQALEASVDAALDVSSLVVPLGGLAIFPAMIYETRDLNFVVEVGAHEWVHNFLTLRPLGLLYDAGPELFTMNETAANLAGKEIGDRVIERFYPERYTPPPPANDNADEGQRPAAEPDPNTFDFRAEMRATRVRVDELLAAGEVDAAEDYMEARRGEFVEQGYNIRKLNQAYFSFYGSYADEPGAAGEDPVGPAVVELRELSGSVKEFLGAMAWITSFEKLEEVLAEKRG